MRRRRDSGVTLIELVVAIAIFGLLSAMAVVGMRSYRDAAGEHGTAEQLTALLRATSMRAIADDATYCVRFESDGVTATLWQSACGTGQSMGTLLTASSGSKFTGASFTQSDGSTAASVSFYPRGAATAGTVTITRTGSSKVYTVTVQGLSGHVWYS